MGLSAHRSSGVLSAGRSRRSESMATRSTRAAVAALVATSAIAGCATDADGEPAGPADPVVGVERSATAATPDVDPISADEPAVAPLDDDVDPQGMITAAVLLRTGGDVDAALAAGSFTRSDLDAARAGLADGSLDHLFD